MMRPLSELNRPVSALEAEALALLGSVSPSDPPSGLRRRVRIRLMEQRLGRPGWPLRRLVAVTVLFCAAAASAAPLFTSWLEVRENPAPTAVVLSSSVRDGAAPSRLPPSSRPFEPAVVASTEPVPSATSVAPRPSTLPRAAARSSATVDEASRLVFEAMRALRREGHPERARSLLAEYESRYGGGPLGEEALALSMEAAVAVGDPRASSLAQRYLKRYPSGHYRPTAERIAARP